MAAAPDFTVSVAPVTDTEGLGPKMRALNPQQRAFVRALVMTGGSDHTKAARMAGYGETPGSQRAAAYRLAHDPKVLAAIKEVAEAEIRTSILVGTRVLQEIAQDVTHKDRLKAATQLLDRGGLIIQQQLNVHLIQETSESDIIARIQSVAAKLGIDPAQLLGKAAQQASLPPPKVVDAEFTEVLLEDDEWTV